MLGVSMTSLMSLLLQLFLKAHVNTSEMTDLIIQQSHVGSVIKVSYCIVSTYFWFDRRLFSSFSSNMYLLVPSSKLRCQKTATMKTQMKCLASSLCSTSQRERYHPWKHQPYRLIGSNNVEN